MSDLQIFNSEQFGTVRTVMIEDEPYFVGKDVTDILGYANSSKALADHVDDEDKLNNESLSSLGQRGGWLINESGLYSLILSSKLPQAKAFKRWVTSEVLPAIRKNEAYITPNKVEELLLNPDAMIRLLGLYHRVFSGYAVTLGVEGLWAAPLGYKINLKSTHSILPVRKTVLPL
mgnify:CR=1 FL=1